MTTHTFTFGDHSVTISDKEYQEIHEKLLPEHEQEMACFNKELEEMPLELEKITRDILAEHGFSDLWEKSIPANLARDIHEARHYCRQNMPDKPRLSRLIKNAVYNKYIK
jgi:AAA+ superfamily predicted ATPase